MTDYDENRPSVAGYERKSMTGYGENRRSMTGYGEYEGNRKSMTGYGENRRMTGYGERKSMTGYGENQQSVTGYGENRRSMTGYGEYQQPGESRKSMTGYGENRLSVSGCAQQNRHSMTGERENRPSGTGNGHRRSTMTGGAEKRNRLKAWCNPNDSLAIPSSPLLEDPPGPEANFRPIMESQVEELQKLREEITRKLEALPVEDEKTGRSEIVTPRELPGRPLLKSKKSLAKSSSPKIITMLDRLEQLEAEEEAIRHRWNTIVYEDARTRPSATTYENTAAENTAAKTDENTAEDKPSATALRWVLGEGTSGCLALDLNDSLPLLTSESLSSIQHYRNKYAQYLRSTGHSTDIPLKMAER